MEDSVAKVLPIHLRRESQVPITLYDPDASLSGWSGAHVYFHCSQ